MVLWWKRFSLELSYLSPPMKQFAFARMVDFHYESAIPKWSRDMGHVAYFKQIVVSSVSLSYLQTFYKKHICPLLYIPPHLQIPRLDQLQCRFHDLTCDAQISFEESLKIVTRMENLKRRTFLSLKSFLGTGVLRKYYWEYFHNRSRSIFVKRWFKGFWNSKVMKVETIRKTSGFELLRSEIPSGMCAKLHTVAASNNRDYASLSLCYCLFAPLIYRVVLRGHSVRGEPLIQRNAIGEVAIGYGRLQHANAKLLSKTLPRFVWLCWLDLSLC